jgi:hypothetical protein
MKVLAEFREKYRDLAASNMSTTYNPPSSSVGSHVFITGNLSVLSGGTVILQII